MAEMISFAANLFKRTFSFGINTNDDGHDNMAIPIEDDDLDNSNQPPIEPIVETSNLISHLLKNLKIIWIF